LAPDGRILLEGTAAPFRDSKRRTRQDPDRGRARGGRAEGAPVFALITVPVFSSARIAVDALAAAPSGEGLAVRLRGPSWGLIPPARKPRHGLA
jgi:hypothetical protein